MAKQFAGKYSPSPGEDEPGHAPNRWRDARPSRAGARANFLFLAPLPLALRAFGQHAIGLALTLAGLGALLLAAWLTREGLLAQDAYNARKIARRPAFPRKIAASLLTGLGLFFAVQGSDGGVVNATVFAVLGAVLHSFAFGLDPLRDKGMEGVNTYQQDRVARAVSEAENHLAAMQDAIRRTGDRKLEARLDRFIAAARDMFRTVEDDPRDLTAARRYLGVYLLGARDATTRFAEIYLRTGDQQARRDYEALLEDLETNFAARTRRLLLDDKTDMNVEIEVLRERLEREALREPRE